MIVPWSPTNRIPSLGISTFWASISSGKRGFMPPSYQNRSSGGTVAAVAANWKRMRAGGRVGEIVLHRPADAVDDRAGVGRPGLGARAARPDPAPANTGQRL